MRIVGDGRGRERSRGELFVNGLFGPTVRDFCSSSFSHLVAYFKKRCVNCFYPRSLVRNKHPRKAVAENLGNLSQLVVFL